MVSTKTITAADGKAFKNCVEIRTVKSTPDPDTFEEYRDTPSISVAILLQKYALLLAESSIYTTNRITIPLPLVQNRLQ